MCFLPTVQIVVAKKGKHGCVKRDVQIYSDVQTQSRRVAFMRHTAARILIVFSAFRGNVAGWVWARRKFGRRIILRVPLAVNIWLFHGGRFMRSRSLYDVRGFTRDVIFSRTSRPGSQLRHFFFLSSSRTRWEMLNNSHRRCRSRSCYA